MKQFILYFIIGIISASSATLFMNMGASFLVSIIGVIIEGVIISLIINIFVNHKK